MTSKELGRLSNYDQTMREYNERKFQFNLKTLEFSVNVDFSNSEIVTIQPATFSESCSCPSTATFNHIIAAKMACKCFGIQEKEQSTQPCLEKRHVLNILVAKSPGKGY